MLLGFALAALLVGPMLWHIAEGRFFLWRLLDGFVFTALGGLIFFIILPHAGEEAGWFALMALAGGLLLPAISERLLRISDRLTHRVLLLVAGLGLVVHGFLDGAALALSANATATSALGLAIIIHRLPMGLTLWWMIVPGFGRAIAAAMLVVLMAVTAVGYVMVDRFSPEGFGLASALAEALLAGLLLHVLAHPIGTLRPRSHPQRRAPKAAPSMAERLGNLLGAGAIAYLALYPVPGDDVHSSHQFPALIVMALALFIVGLAIARVIGRSRSSPRFLDFDASAAWTLMIFLLLMSLPAAAPEFLLGPLPTVMRLALTIAVVALWLISWWRKGARGILAYLTPGGHKHDHHHH